MISADETKNQAQANPSQLLSARRMLAATRGPGPGIDTDGGANTN
jgi:hypothetical protein